MKELNRYDFSNDKSFSTQLLDADDTRRLELPECDVISLRRCYDNGTSHAWAMRPDEALVLAKLLIDAVWQVEHGVTEFKPNSSSQSTRDWQRVEVGWAGNRENLISDPHCNDLP